VVSNIRQIIVDVILELVDLVADASQGEGYVPEDDDAENRSARKTVTAAPPRSSVLASTIYATL